jgi:hypothetical protein
MQITAHTIFPLHDPSHEAENAPTALRSAVQHISAVLFFRYSQLRTAFNDTPFPFPLLTKYSNLLKNKNKKKKGRTSRRNNPTLRVFSSFSSTRKFSTVTKASWLGIMASKASAIFAKNGKNAADEGKEAGPPNVRGS